MRPASLHSYKQRFIYENLPGDDSKLLLYRMEDAKKMPTTPKQRTWRGKLYPSYIVSGSIDFK